MIYVIEGTLRLELSEEIRNCQAGEFTIYSSAQDYSYVNVGRVPVRFVRNVIS